MRLEPPCNCSRKRLLSQNLQGTFLTMYPLFKWGYTQVVLSKLNFKCKIAWMPLRECCFMLPPFSAAFSKYIYAIVVSWPAQRSWKVITDTQWQLLCAITYPLQDPEMMKGISIWRQSILAQDSPQFTVYFCCTRFCFIVVVTFYWYLNVGTVYLPIVGYKLNYKLNYEIKYWPYNFTELVFSREDPWFQRDWITW